MPHGPSPLAISIQQLWLRGHTICNHCQWQTGRQVGMATECDHCPCLVRSFTQNTSGHGHTVCGHQKWPTDNPRNQAAGNAATVTAHQSYRTWPLAGNELITPNVVLSVPSWNTMVHGHCKVAWRELLKPGHNVTTIFTHHLHCVTRPHSTSPPLEADGHI